jgi:hypothetical protein
MEDLTSSSPEVKSAGIHSAGVLIENPHIPVDYYRELKSSQESSGLGTK